jgi:hypothetical protein
MDLSKDFTWPYDAFFVATPGEVRDMTQFLKKPVFT